MEQAAARQPHPRSHLFTVRLWVEPFGNDQAEVRMQVQHLLSGERHYFRDWSQLTHYLQAKLSELNQANP